MKDSDITDDVCSTMESMTLAHSFLCSGRIPSKLLFYKYFNCLRVLDILRTRFWEFPSDIVMLLNLRYLALPSVGFRDLPSELSQLWKLQILIIRVYGGVYAYVPQEILNMTQLRHLQIEKYFLPNDLHDSVILKNVQRLSTVANFRCTEEFLKKFPNLQKLVVYYTDVDGTEDWSDYHLKNLVHIHKLENLKCRFNGLANETLLPNLSFPKTLKELTLAGSNLFWKDMTIIGSLPCLEVLKLKEESFRGPVWEPVEGEFLRLKYLKLQTLAELVQWIAEDTHFPCLEYLIIQECFSLKMIPLSIGEIATLNVIDIDDSSLSAAASVEQILEEQRSLENHALQVRVRRLYWKD